MINTFTEGSGAALLDLPHPHELTQHVGGAQVLGVLRVALPASKGL